MSADALFFQRHDDWQQRLEKTFSPDLWSELNPHLKITDRPWGESPFPLSEADLARAQEQVREEGYLQTEPVIPEATTSGLARAVRNLVDFGLHPIFLCAYDEYWQMLQGVARALEPILGPNCYPLGDFWSWLISPENATRGWGPHRDAQFAGRKCLREDKTPLIVTAWLPLLDTDPLNGCMSVLPMNLDPNLPVNPGSNAFSNLQDVRALPAKAGAILAWNQYLLHWGGRCSKWAPNPRISSGIYFQSADVEPYVERTISFERDLPLRQRLLHASVSILNYHGDHNYPAPVVSMCKRHIQSAPELHEQLPPYLQKALAAQP